MIARLEAGDKVGIDRLETVEAPDELPPGWRRLSELLSAAGTDVRQKVIQAPVEASSDLGRLHVFLKQGTRSELDWRRHQSSRWRPRPNSRPQRPSRNGSRLIPMRGPARRSSSPRRAARHCSTWPLHGWGSLSSASRPHRHSAAPCRS